MNRRTARALALLRAFPGVVLALLLVATATGLSGPSLTHVQYERASGIQPSGKIALTRSETLAVDPGTGGSWGDGDPAVLLAAGGNPKAPETGSRLACQTDLCVVRPAPNGLNRPRGPPAA